MNSEERLNSNRVKRQLCCILSILILQTCAIFLTFHFVPILVDHRTSAITYPCLHGFSVRISNDTTDNCECFGGFMKHNGNSQCSYEQKLWLAASLLQTFPWTGLFGIGMIYIGSTAGIVQLTFSQAVLYYILIYSKDKLLAYSYATIMVLWWIITSIILWCNVLYDKNGMPLHQ